MDEFKSEDELRPDSSDRRPPRQRKGPSVPKIAMSRQHLMIGIGILILLLVVIGVGSALKSPSTSDADRPSQSPAEKNIDLSGSSAPAANGATSPATTAGQPAAANPAAANPANTAMSNGTVNGGNGAAPAQPQTLSVPPVAQTPSLAPPVTAPAPQHRIDLPGNMADALSQQGDQVNGMTEQMNNEGAASTLPTAPALVAPSAKEAKESAHKTGVARTPAAVHKTLKQTESVPSSHNALATRPAAKAFAAGGHAVAPAPMATVSQHAAPAAGTSQHIAPTVSTGTAGRHAAAPAAAGSIQSAPAGFYTLQLSSASQAATLNAYAQKQQLSQYWVYETRRAGKPWYVLVSGVYPTSTQAKSAVAQLPVDIQANKPWARQIGQVKQDQNK